jgi:NAD(P)-dependent dehydrogenase (short-subunit alcohol dehydrogenase family)
MEERISLRSAGLGDGDVERIADWVSRTAGVVALDLAGNELSELGPLLEVVAAHPALERIDVRGNPLSGASEDGLTRAAEANARLVFIESDLAGEARAARLGILCRNRDARSAPRRGAAISRTSSTRGGDVRGALEALANTDGPLEGDARWSEWGDLVARLQRRKAREARPEPRPKVARKERVKPPPPVANPMWERSKCYACHAKFELAHPRYHAMCPSCGDLNLEKRESLVDLSGRSYVLTGARTKIGFALGKRLLRSGARVIGTTRFPHDCARRYAIALDGELGRDALEERLAVHALDLRDLGSVEELCARLREEEPGLDGVINLAAQTVWRPPEQYAHLFPIEEMASAALPHGWGDLVRSRAPEHLVRALEPLVRKLLPGTTGTLPLDLQPREDERETNSWRSRLAEVETRELVEVHVVNAIAPFVLMRELLPLLRAREGARHIVNVSAVEGQFYRRWKGPNHPHCNMAKSALNQLVLTVHDELAKEGVYVTAVDTGWVSNDNPLPLRERMREAGFKVPLDVEDGAARVYDPIARSVADDDHVHGVFLKDYRAAPW